MPTFNLSIEITDKQANRLQKWFPKWNATLDAPYETFQDALIDILKHQVSSFIDTSHSPDIIATEYEKATQEVKDQIDVLLDLE